MVHIQNKDIEKIRTIFQKYWCYSSVVLWGYHTKTVIQEGVFPSNSSLKATVPHYYLVAFTTNNTMATGTNRANTIVELLNHQIGITLALHHPKDLATKNPTQQYFFNNLLRHGQNVYTNPTVLPYLKHKAPNTKNRVEDFRFWLKCEAVAVFNIQAAKESPQQEVERCKIALLHTACVQIALGLIRVKMGYSPNEFSLNYLLQWCGYFMPLPFPVFNNQTKEQSYRYKLLCAPPTMLNHWMDIKASTDDFNYLLTNTQDFLSLAQIEMQSISAAK